MMSVDVAAVLWVEWDAQRHQLAAALAVDDYKNSSCFFFWKSSEKILKKLFQLKVSYFPLSYLCIFSAQKCALQAIHHELNNLSLSLSLFVPPLVTLFIDLIWFYSFIGARPRSLVLDSFQHLRDAILQFFISAQRGFFRRFFRWLNQLVDFEPMEWSGGLAKSWKTSQYCNLKSFFSRISWFRHPTIAS